MVFFFTSTHEIVFVCGLSCVIGMFGLEKKDFNDWTLYLIKLE